MPEKGTNRSDAAVRRLAEAFDPDPKHSAHVTSLALRLFDALRGLHRLGERPRRLLWTAATLHDIGWSGKPGAGHHKRSRDMILESGIEMPGKDLDIVAQVARYHTKAEPDLARHRRFAALLARDRRTVEWLAGVLRIADGLDCSHSCHVRIEGCRITACGIALSVGPAGASSPEIQAARRKAGLLERISGRKVELAAAGRA